MALTDEPETTCYRHPDRPTGLRCGNCERPICAECMRVTPVGQRCPECVGRQRTLRPRTMSAIMPVVTYALIAINVLVFLGPEKGLSGGGGIGLTSTSVDIRWGALYAFPLEQHGEWYRVLTSMFMHGGIVHILFNMWALYAFGPALEQRLGPVRFALLYLVAGIAGGAGALIASPNAPTIGASGAIFGLLAAIFVVERRYGASVMSGAGGLIAINLVLTFSLANISAGGHIGGLIGGGVLGWLIERNPRARRGLLDPGTLAAAVAVGAVACVAIVLAAHGTLRI